MKRGEPLKRGKRLERRTEIRKRNNARAAKRRARDFGAQAKLCRTLPCCVCGAVPSVPAHVRGRGAGGRDDQTVPLCDPCHRAQHDEGIETFQRRREINLRAIADSLREQIEGGQ